MNAPLLLAFACVTGILTAQTTWTVDRLNRPGTDFLDLQPAVDAAASGDVIRIRAAGAPVHGAASYRAPVIDGKSLTLIGQGSDDGPTSTWMRGLLWVRNLAPGQVVRFVDFVVWESDFGTVGSGMRLEGNSGPVLLDGVRLEVTATISPPWIVDSRLVVFQNVQFVARPLELSVYRSSLVVSDSTLRSVFSISGLPNDAMGLVDSRLWMQHSSVFGRDGTAQSPATDAIFAQASELSFGPGTYLQGGFGPSGRMNSLRVRVLVGGEDTYVHIDPGASFLGRVEGQWTAEAVPALRTTTDGTTRTIDQFGTPQALVLLAAGPLLPTPWSGPEGLLAIDPLPGLAWLAFAPASGPLQWTFPEPPGLPADFVLGLQGAELRLDGTVGLTDLATITGR